MEQTVIETQYALDTFYLLVSGMLVMGMGVGFTMLQVGLIRAKNTIAVLTQNLALYAIAYLAYLLIGYQLMYPEAPSNPVWPGIGFLIGRDHAVTEVLQSNGGVYYSKMADFFFQAAFVVTVISIVSGAMAERTKLFPFLLFALVMAGFIYPLQGYWKWGGGFLDEPLRFFDFAGAGVVHLCGASAALAGVLLLGPRAGKYGPDGEIYLLPGCNLPLASLGAYILWLGWFGFTGGAELKISNIAEANAVARVFVNTHASAAAGAIAALLTARAWFGRTDLAIVLNGVLAGLVAITAEPLTPAPWQSLGVGAIGGVIAVFSKIGLDKLRLDDPVGALSVHGAAGIWGLVAVCLTNPQAKLSGQLIGIVAIFGSVFTASFLVWLVIKRLVGIRLSEADEQQGVDVSQCGMEAYPKFMRK
ncbi:MAG: ammonium transporter [Methylohalobius sp.]